jgi:DNA-binding NarL/FixJ family response regulator
VNERRVVVVDDSIFVREGVAAVLRSGGFDVAAELAEATQLTRTVSEHRADIAVLDVRMPPTHTTEGIQAALRLRAQVPAFPVLLLSQYVETTHLDTLLATGASGIGYLLKDRVLDARDFLDAVDRVGRGGSALDPDVVTRLMTGSRAPVPLERLTARERDVLALMAEGWANNPISQRLGIGTRTLESHIASIFTKLDLLPVDEVHRRVAAVVAWLRNPETPSHESATPAAARRDPKADRGLTTLMFTDIVDSTAHASAVGDRAWRTLLDAHDDMTRQAINRFGGREVKTTGDGFLATFDTPAHGIRCAVAVRAGATGLGLEVRAGLHTGEVDRRADDIGGIAVHVSQRILDAAQPGDILVSSTVKHLVTGSETEFDDLGEHTLKGLTETWRLYRVRT